MSEIFSFPVFSSSFFIQGFPFFSSEKRNLSAKTSFVLLHKLSEKKIFRTSFSSVLFNAYAFFWAEEKKKQKQKWPEHIVA